MALRLIEGWESYGTSTSGAIIPDEKWARGGSIGTTRVPGRHGGVALQLSGASENIAQVQLFDPEPQTIIVGFAMKLIDTTDPQFVFEARINSNQRTRITVNSDRTLSISQGATAPLATGTTVLDLDTWYFIELKTFVAETGNGAGDGTYHLKINGVTEVSGTGPLVPSGRNGVNLVTFNSGGSFGVTALQIDDVYICDDQGSVNNDFLGDIRVEEIFPNGDDTQSWTTSSGSDHWSLVDDNPRDDDATYVETSSNGSDIFDYTSRTGTGQIHGILVNSMMKGTGPAEVKNVVKSGATVDDTSSPLFSFHTNTWIDYWTVYENDPDTGLPWDDAGINAAKFGVIRSAGSPRLTKQWVQIVYTHQEPSNDIEVEVESEITFSQEAVGVAAFLEEIEQAIEFEQTLISNIKAFDLVDEITFVDGATRVIPVSVDSEIIFDDDVQVVASIIARFLPAGMYDGEIYDPTNIPFSPNDILTLTQSLVVGGSRRFSVSSALVFNQTVGVSLPVINRSITSLLSFSDRVGRVIEQSASSALLLTDKAEKVQSEKSLLSLSQDIQVYRGRNVKSPISLAQVLSYTFTGARSVESQIPFNQSLLVYLERLAQECTYSPQIGNIGSGIIPPFPDMPTLGQAQLTLTYPYTSPTNTLVLKNPEFGNLNRLNFMRIKTVSRGGGLILFADPDWPKEQTLSLTITGLNKQQKDDFEIFLTQSLGKEIGLLDHENRQWRGIITNPDTAITHAGRHNYTFTIEFEGEPPVQFLPI